MALELKLHSPAGAEPIIYTWPLQKMVSFSAGISLSALYFEERDGVLHQCLVSYMPETLSDCLTFRTAEMKRQKLWKPLGNWRSGS